MKFTIKYRGEFIREQDIPGDVQPHTAILYYHQTGPLWLEGRYSVPDGVTWDGETFNVIGEAEKTPDFIKVGYSTPGQQGYDAALMAIKTVHPDPNI